MRNDPNSNGWFRRHLRCDRVVFAVIARRIEDAWTRIHPAPYHNTVFCIADRVACYLHYLTHADGYETTGVVFGVSKTQARLYCRQVAKVLTGIYLRETIQLPTTAVEWEEIRQGMEEIAGFPNAYGAIDGSLISVKRFADFMGWYCRKGFPAFNMQALVDHKLRFRSYSLRSGSQNDKSLFNKSRLGQVLHQMIYMG